ncbi:hypothetical protein [Shinella sp. NM-101]|uniref:hypothetical protein n=1 Tax=Shinella sp. NM-101 TaxID=2744455 RepID=UPI001F350A24|nr:hypothetical protein [Shinella sp. NM-101]
MAGDPRRVGDRFDLDDPAAFHLHELDHPGLCAGDAVWNAAVRHFDEKGLAVFVVEIAAINIRTASTW